MNKFTLTALSASVLMALSLPAYAQPAANQERKPAATETEKLQHELQQLKQLYLDKIQQLEQRIEQLAQDNEDTQEDVEELAINVSQQGNQKAENTFNPGIWMILNGRFVQYNDNFDYQLPGFFPAEEIGPGEQGLQLGESELNMKANVDDKFYAWTTIAFGEEGASVEEAYLQTLNLGNGFNIKLGRFFSDVGYLSSKHVHTDNFADRPLPYAAMLGSNLTGDGVQVTWLAPTELYWESGTELYRGDSFPAAGAANSGKGVYTVFTHLGGDIGSSQSWRAGVSFVHADVEGLATDDGDSFTGTNKLWIADFIYKWAPNGNRAYQEFNLQGEYLTSSQEGLFTNASLTDEAFKRDQNGWYIEGVYRFAKQWRVGLRTSALQSDQLPAVFNGSLLDAGEHNPTQHSLMLDWTNSEFSRVRLQYDVNNLNGDNENVWILQYIASFGAHGAHTF
jgi:hypothetical protein